MLCLNKCVNPILLLIPKSDRHQLVQQMQQIGNGALGPQAASAIRVVAAQNGVWSLGNFGGLPPQTSSNNSAKQDVSVSRQRLWDCIPVCIILSTSLMRDISYQVKHTDAQSDSSITATQTNRDLVTSVEESEYRHIFQSCSVAMVRFHFSL